MRPSRARLALLLAAIPCLLAGNSARAGDENRPWLGVSISSGARGVSILEVIRDAPADEAGLEVGDEIIAVAGARVATPGDLTQEIMRYGVADRVALKIWRDNELLDMAVILGPRLDQDEIMHRRFVGLESPGFNAEIVYGRDSGSARQLRGNLVVLQLFSMGCSACLEQHGELSRLADEYAGQGLVVLAVNSDARLDLGRWAARLSPSFSVGFDPLGAVFRTFRVDGMEPVLVVVDRAGVVRYAGIGGAGNLARAVASVELLSREERRAR